MNIFTQLRNTKNLTNNEKQIVDFILDNPNAFLNMSSEQICKECFVSTTTLYRLCQKFNLSGLSDLKVKMSGSINSYLKENKDFDFDFPVKQNQSHYEILTKIREDYDQTLLSTFNLFNLEQLRLSVNAMKKAKQIDVYTSAGNIFFAENFKFQMQEIGITINVPEEEYNQRLVASCSDENHLAIVISFGGRGLLVNKIIKTLKGNKTPILLISSTEDSPIKEYADYQLYLCSNENHYNKISSFSTRLSLLYILDILFACYFKTDYDKNLEKKLNYYKKMIES
ncbi:MULTISPECIES: MurR/RpiR family transcriptional regulator [Clostridium]|uniref:RpiR family transcriptional regulator n=1 Tax=Clostridium disporicum TaxID=84024 RepID=A0A174KQI9_9CLOT|nr:MULTISPECIES: MurR/RpiR family transcriptional regulator [Clostridium]MCD2501595.1 MurR/RpiR family transcriptional regulator [Clostridium sp. NSJ-145]CUP12716.1 RpiR family transcriptional regulator [Clostridium disporicum]